MSALRDLLAVVGAVELLSVLGLVVLVVAAAWHQASAGRQADREAAEALDNLHQLTSTELAEFHRHGINRPR